MLRRLPVAIAGGMAQVERGLGGMSSNVRTQSEGPRPILGGRFGTCVVGGLSPKPRTTVERIPTSPMRPPGGRVGRGPCWSHGPGLVVGAGPITESSPSYANCPLDPPDVGQDQYYDRHYDWNDNSYQFQPELKITHWMPPSVRRESVKRHGILSNKTRGRPGAANR